MSLVEYCMPINKSLFFAVLILCFIGISCQESVVEDPVIKDPVVDVSELPAHIGDIRGGGIVFWVNPSDSTNGLCVAMSDLYAAAQWGCEGTSINGANKTGLFGGAKNTKDILSRCRFAGIAADLCDEAVDRGYSDWYLPSTGEIREIQTHLSVIEKTAIDSGGRAFYDVYWSSNQPSGVVGETLAYAMDIRKNQITQERKNKRFAVRAVREFNQH